MVIMKKVIILLCLILYVSLAYTDSGDTPQFWYDDPSVGEIWTVDEDDVWTLVDLPGDYWVTTIETLDDKLYIGTKESGIIVMNSEGEFEFK